MERISLGGLEFIMNGLEYHYLNFANKNSNLFRTENDPISIFNKKNKQIIFEMKHEAVAYLNRVGQFYYFVTSKEIKSLIRDSEEQIPQIIYLLPFRHKYSAHRAIDKPKESENLFNMNQLDLLFSNMTICSNNHIVFQIFIDDYDARQFDLLTQHHKIIEEMKNILIKIKSI